MFDKRPTDQDGSWRKDWGAHLRGEPAQKAIEAAIESRTPRNGRIWGFVTVQRILFWLYCVDLGLLTGWLATR